MSYYAFTKPSPLAGIEAFGTTLASILEKRGERGYQKELKQEERDYQARLLEEDRQRQKQYGTTMGRVITESGVIDSLDKAQQTVNTAIAQGVPPDLAHKAVEPHVKALGKKAEATYAAEINQKRLEALFGPQLGQPLQAPGEPPQAPGPSLEALDQPPAGQPSQAPVQPPLIDTSARDNFPRTITDSRGRVYNQDDILRILGDSDPGIREIGKALDKQLKNEQSNYLQEQAKKREGYRKDIKEHAEPYKNITDLQNKVNRLDQVQQIIDTEPASFNENFWRTTARALLEDMGSSTFATLFKNDAQRKVYSLLRTSFNTKEIGGSNPSTREVLMTMETLPSGFKSKISNEYITKLLKNEAEITLEQAKIISEIRDNDQTFSEYQNAIQQRIAPFQEKKQQELARLSEIQVAKAQLKNLHIKKGHSAVLAPDGTIKQIPRKEVARVTSPEAGGVLLKR